MSLKKVLVVEDLENEQEYYREELQDKDVVLISAYTVEEAEKLFAEHPDLDAIVMDACVPGEVSTTLPLVRKLRKSFTGPIIAASSNRQCRLDLVREGCSHETSKIGVPRLLLNILGLS